ncbi:KH domain-containing protein [Candidatus Saccharibacteria bacterium]|nr:KH domain-containing protein [Candidatus Saccharibacteria bacterium]
MSATIDQQFVEYVVKSLVGHPDDVRIDRRVDEKGVLLELTVNPEDLGRVIGKRGATAQSLRTLLRALGTKQEARYNLKIVDVDKLDENGNPIERPERLERTERPAREEQREVPKPEPASSAAASTNDDDDDITASDLADEKKDIDRVARTRAELADLDDLDI